MWAPPDDALQLAFVAARVHPSQCGLLNECAAAPAAPTVTPEDIRGLPCPLHTGSHADWRVTVGPDEATGDGEDEGNVDKRCGRGWMHASQKTDLRTIFVAQTGHIGLV